VKTRWLASATANQGRPSAAATAMILSSTSVTLRAKVTSKPECRNQRSSTS
jgi:hypothetical protein